MHADYDIPFVKVVASIVVDLAPTNGLRGFSTKGLDAALRAVMPSVAGVTTVAAKPCPRDVTLRRAWDAGLAITDGLRRGRMIRIEVLFSEPPPPEAADVIARIIREHRVED